MLTVTDRLPKGLLGLETRDLAAALRGPVLIHLPGRRRPPLFVSVLLHGNEDVGWRALRRLLDRYADRELPRSLSLFIGNVAAAAEGKRLLPGQPDYNRIWTGEGEEEERGMTRQVVDEMRGRGVFASIDVHSNTGLNPHYACVQDLDNRSLQLAALFARTVVLARKPDGVQVQAFSALCPSVTVECGRVGQERGAGHAMTFIEACLRLSDIPDHAVPEHDIDLFHTVAVVRVPGNISFSFDGRDADVSFRRDIDHLNFRELSPGTPIGKVREGAPKVLEVSGESGQDVAERYFITENGVLSTVSPFTPSMLTVDVEAVRLDCLGYLMERLPRDAFGGPALS